MVVEEEDYSRVGEREKEEEYIPLPTYANF